VGRRARRWGVLLLAVLLAPTLLLLVQVARWRPLPLVGEPPADGYTRVAGVVHVHTTLSDGGGTPEEVIASAKAAGLAFVGITDHNNVDAMPFAGYRDGLLVLVGAELSTPAGHVLGVGFDRDPPFRFNGDALAALEDIRDLGGVAFAAHPFSAREDLRFTGWDLPGPWGLELLNSDSEWRRAGPRLLLAAGLYQVNPRYALLQILNPPGEALARWNVMLARRDVVGLAGADAHSRLPLTRKRSLRFPSYEALFNLARDHLLLGQPLSGDAAQDRRAVLDALREGRFYLGLDALAPADRFGFTISGGGEVASLGDHVAPRAGLVARAGGRVPRGTRLTLLRDGAPVAEGQERLEAGVPGPGVYAVEARIDGWAVPWVLTNPIYVFDEATLTLRRQAAEWPPAPSPQEVVPLSSLPGTSAFSAEFDPTSWMDPQVGEAGGDEEEGGGGVWKLAFRLAAPSPRQAFTWCALVNRQERDLTGYRGLRFRIRGDGEHGLWVQVRDANPASADEGQEWWLASARSSTEWREVFLPFSRFRTINPRTDGHLDLDQARAIVFVLDGASEKVGTNGTVWIADVGVYR
jgi:hypothetical protein